MEIGLIRVDSRLIHGQVITKWLNYSKANVIVVVDDELSKDSFMSEIYKASAPNGIIVEILSIDDFMKNTGTHKYSNKRLLILLKNIETESVFEKGTETVWICRNCGYIHTAQEAPEVCPVCAHAQAFFEVRAENY